MCVFCARVCTPFERKRKFDNFRKEKKKGIVIFCDQVSFVLYFFNAYPEKRLAKTHKTKFFGEWSQHEPQSRALLKWATKLVRMSRKGGSRHTNASSFPWLLFRWRRCSQLKGFCFGKTYFQYIQTHSDIRLATWDMSSKVSCSVIFLVSSPFFPCL